jgi:hypothetical protein
MAVAGPPSATAQDAPRIFPSIAIDAHANDSARVTAMQPAARGQAVVEVVITEIYPKNLSIWVLRHARDLQVVDVILIEQTGTGRSNGLESDVRIVGLPP